MSIHITPPPRAGQPEPKAAEPARRASRFDERGIALQTIIIMVVLLAIAGSVAAVIATRAGEETGRLEETDSSVYGITNEAGCKLGGGEWATGATPAEIEALKRAGIDTTGFSTTVGKWCKPG